MGSGVGIWGREDRVGVDDRYSTFYFFFRLLVCEKYRDLAIKIIRLWKKKVKTVPIKVTVAMQRDGEQPAHDAVK